MPVFKPDKIFSLKINPNLYWCTTNLQFRVQFRTFTLNKFMEKVCLQKATTIVKKYSANYLTTAIQKR